MTNHGLLVLVAACKVWAVPGGKCPPDLLLRKVNRWLDESHKLDPAELNAICLELEQQTGSRVVAPGSDDEKQRDDGNFEDAVKDAFKVSTLAVPFFGPTEFLSTLYTGKVLAASKQEC